MKDNFLTFTHKNILSSVSLEYLDLVLVHESEGNEGNASRFRFTINSQFDVRTSVPIIDTRTGMRKKSTSVFGYL